MINFATKENIIAVSRNYKGESFISGGNIFDYPKVSGLTEELNTVEFPVELPDVDNLRIFTEEAINFGSIIEYRTDRGSVLLNMNTKAQHFVPKIFSINPTHDTTYLIQGRIIPAYVAEWYTHRINYLSMVGSPTIISHEALNVEEVIDSIDLWDVEVQTVKINDTVYKLYRSKKEHSIHLYRVDLDILSSLSLADIDGIMRWHSSLGDESVDSSAIQNILFK